MPWDRRWWQRPGLVAGGVVHLVAALLLWQNQDMVSVGVFWPVWFGATGVSLCVFAFRPSSEFWFYVAGAMLVLAWASRSAWLVAELPLNGWQEATDYRRGIGVIGYGMLSAALWRLWLLEIRPWHNVWWARRTVRKTP